MCKERFSTTMEVECKVIPREQNLVKLKGTKVTNPQV